MPALTFSRYQMFVVAILAFLQFTVILDFLILSPLGAILITDLHITTQQFGYVVSVYALSAGLSGIVTAGFADRFDRKKLLIVFYVGFILGTALCGLAHSFRFLLIARIVTGLFGGVIGATVMAIAADLFPLEMRGRVMGIVQTAFAGSQVAGLPAGLLLCNWWGWHAPFFMIAGIGAVVGLVIAVGLRPIADHLKSPHDRNAFQHLRKTVSNRTYQRGFAATILLATGGFMLLPFGSTFTVNNLGISLTSLPTIYLVTGLCTILTGPLIGRLTDVIGKYRVFFIGTLLGIALVLINCNLGITPLWLVILINVLLFVAITARMISTSSLISAVPVWSDRGAYMSINSSLQQFSGAVASSLAGMIVVQNSSQKLEHYDILGYVVVTAMLITLYLMRSVDVLIKARMAGAPTKI